MTENANIYLPEERLDPSRARPFSQFVLKMHGFCNLACDYCYVYEMADQTWRERSDAMPPNVLEQAARRIGEHVTKHGLSVAKVAFHGGEPLLVGAERLAADAEVVRSYIPKTTELKFLVQTNGVLLDERTLDILLANKIGVGVSVDGVKSIHDAHRLDRRGKGSFDRVAEKLHLLGQEKYKDIYAGLLCVANVESDPIETYETLRSFKPPSVNLILPHGNWTTPPPGRSPDSSDTPYADWLIPMFDAWYDDKSPHMPDIDYFNSIIYLWLGGRSVTEFIGSTPDNARFLIIEGDGAIEQTDTLKSTYHGAASTGLNVFEHELDAAMTHPGILARMMGRAGLSQTCQQCPLVQGCGGGYYSHRYKAGLGFDNPSVYCSDLKRLVRHVYDRVSTDINRQIESNRHKLNQSDKNA